jgi:hypothetical protein
MDQVIYSYLNRVLGQAELSKIESDILKEALAVSDAVQLRCDKQRLFIYDKEAFDTILHKRFREARFTQLFHRISEYATQNQLTFEEARGQARQIKVEVLEKSEPEKTREQQVYADYIYFRLKPIPNSPALTLPPEGILDLSPQGVWMTN